MDKQNCNLDTKKWGAIVSLISGIANSISHKYSETGVDYAPSLIQLLTTEESDPTNYARGLLNHFIDFAKSFGFSGITILIDKADETDFTSNSATASATLLHPILVNIQLLEIEDFGWIFFLWDSLYKDYNGEKLKIRLDKIANAHINWPKPSLQEIIAQRLYYFSEGRIQKTEEIFAESASQLIDESIDISMSSPRELIRIFDTILRENEEQDPHIQKLTIAHTQLALDKYCAEATKRIFEKQQLQQITKLGKTVFINKDVQTTFRINIQSAKSRIDGWMDSGIATLSGSRPAEGGGGGKPANEYSVIDSRIRRLINKNIFLGADYAPIEE